MLVATAILLFAVLALLPELRNRPALPGRPGRAAQWANQPAPDFGQPAAAQPSGAGPRTRRRRRSRRRRRTAARPPADAPPPGTLRRRRHVAAAGDASVGRPRPPVLRRGRRPTELPGAA